jgi:hypothetical protein
VKDLPDFFSLALTCACQKGTILSSDLMEADANVVLHLQVECRGAPATASATAPARRAPAPTGLEHRIRKLRTGKSVLLHNGGFYNGCITKRILLLQASHSYEN